MELLDNFFRFGGIASCLFTAALVYREGRCTLSGKLGVICCLNVALWLFIYTPDLYNALGPFMMTLSFLCQVGPIIIWLFCLSLFDDAFEVSTRHYAFGGAFLAIELLLHYSVIHSTGQTLLTSPATAYIIINAAGAESVFLGLLIQMFKLGIAMHLCYVAWSGRYDDLVEERRRFRSVFVMFVAISFAWIAALESYMLRHGVTHAINFFLVTQSASVFFIQGYMLWHLTSLKGEWLFGAVEEVPPVSLRRYAAEDRHDLEVLQKVADQDGLLEPGLTISRLAGAVNMPEHRLRRLINQHLGYRNFSDYLNYHRIEAAKLRLAAIEDRHLPVLSVAMDLGYGSLGPFNRAFKERAGMTPTEYRKKILAEC